MSQSLGLFAKKVDKHPLTGPKIRKRVDAGEPRHHHNHYPTLNNRTYNISSDEPLATVECRDSKVFMDTSYDSSGGTNNFTSYQHDPWYQTLGYMWPYQSPFYSFRAPEDDSTTDEKGSGTQLRRQQRHLAQLPASGSGIGNGADSMGSILGGRSDPGSSEDIRGGIGSKGSDGPTIIKGDIVGGVIERDDYEHLPTIYDTFSDANFGREGSKGEFGKARSTSATTYEQRIRTPTHKRPNSSTPCLGAIGLASTKTSLSEHCLGTFGQTMDHVVSEVGGEYENSEKFGNGTNESDILLSFNGEIGSMRPATYAQVINDSVKITKELNQMDLISDAITDALKSELWALVPKMIDDIVKRFLREHTDGTVSYPEEDRFLAKDLKHIVKIDGHAPTFDGIMRRNDHAKLWKSDKPTKVLKVRKGTLHNQANESNSDEVENYSEGYKVPVTAVTETSFSNCSDNPESDNLDLTKNFGEKRYDNEDEDLTQANNTFSSGYHPVFGITIPDDKARDRMQIVQANNETKDVRTKNYYDTYALCHTNYSANEAYPPNGYVHEDLGRTDDSVIINLEQSSQYDKVLKDHMESNATAVIRDPMESYLPNLVSPSSKLVVPYFSASEGIVRYKRKKGAWNKNYLNIYYNAYFNNKHHTKYGNGLLRKNYQTLSSQARKERKMQKRKLASTHKAGNDTNDPAGAVARYYGNDQVPSSATADYRCHTNLPGQQLTAPTVPNHPYPITQSKSKREPKTPPDIGVEGRAIEPVGSSGKFDPDTIPHFGMSQITTNGDRPDERKGEKNTPCTAVSFYNVNTMAANLDSIVANYVGPVGDARTAHDTNPTKHNYLAAYYESMVLNMQTGSPYYGNGGNLAKFWATYSNTLNGYGRREHPGPWARFEDAYSCPRLDLSGEQVSPPIITSASPYSWQLYQPQQMTTPSPAHFLTYPTLNQNTSTTQAQNRSSSLTGLWKPEDLTANHICPSNKKTFHLSGAAACSMEKGKSPYTATKLAKCPTGRPGCEKGDRKKLASYGNGIGAIQGHTIPAPSSAVRDSKAKLKEEMAELFNGNTEITRLTPIHLRKAKLMFFYTRYPNSNVLKTYFPDIKFNRNNIAQLVKWFSNFREFFYIQMEKFARQALAEDVTDGQTLRVAEDSELYRTLIMHYNRNNHIQIPEHFRKVCESTLREFFGAICNYRDREPSWKKSIYKIIAQLDMSIPDYFKTNHFLKQLE